MKKIRIIKKASLGLSIETGKNTGLNSGANPQWYNQTNTTNSFSEPDLQVNSTLHETNDGSENVETEDGETVFTDKVGDGIAQLYKIKGDRHYDGGVKLNLPEDSFIFSRDKKMKIGGPILESFGKNKDTKDKFTPAELSSKYKINDFRKVLADPNTDKTQRDTAELMISNYNLKLAKLGLVQESTKGFPDGIPAIAMPYLEMMQLDPSQFVAPQGQQNDPTSIAKYGGGLPKAQMGSTGATGSKGASQLQTMYDNAKTPTEKKAVMDYIKRTAPSLANKIITGLAKTTIAPIQENWRNLSHISGAVADEAWDIVKKPFTDMYNIGSDIYNKFNEPQLSPEERNIYDQFNKQIQQADSIKNNTKDINVFNYELGGSLPKHQTTGPVTIKNGWYKEGNMYVQYQNNNIVQVSGSDPKLAITPVTKSEITPVTVAPNTVDQPKINTTGNYVQGKTTSLVATPTRTFNPTAADPDGKGVYTASPGEKTPEGIDPSSIYTKEELVQRYKDMGIDYPNMTDAEAQSALYDKADPFEKALMWGRIGNTKAGLSLDQEAKFKKYKPKLNESLSTYKKRLTETGYTPESLNKELEPFKTSFADSLRGVRESWLLTPNKDDTGIASEKGKDEVSGPGPLSGGIGDEYSPLKPKFWLQDEIKTAGAAWDKLNIKKYNPWQATPGYALEEGTFYDPTRELAASAEMVNQGVTGASTFSGPQGFAATASMLQGQGAKNACVSDDTEILTENGWETVHSLKVGTKIVTVNPKTLMIEIQKCSNINVYDIDEEVVEIENRVISAISTKNHKWLTYRKLKTQFTNSDKLSNYGDDRIYLSGIGNQFKGTNLWTNDEIELIGLVLTDGHYQPKYENTVGVAQAKIKNIDHIQNLFNRLGKHGHHIRKNNGKNSSFGGNLDLHLWSISGEIGKKIRIALPSKLLNMSFLLQLSSEQLIILYNAMLMGDGCHSKQAGGRARTIACGKKMFAEAFTMLCVMIGKPVTIQNRDPRKYNKNAKPTWNILWEVYLKQQNKGCAHLGKRNIHYKGIVWCPTVQNSTWIAKRNNKIYVTGNSDIMGRYNNMNVSEANRLNSANTAIKNNASQQRANAATQLFDKQTIANQQFDNSKNMARQNLRQSFMDAITNRANTANLNSMYPQYAVDPSTGGMVNYISGSNKELSKTQGTPATSQSQFDVLKKAGYSLDEIKIILGIKS